MSAVRLRRVALITTWIGLAALPACHRENDRQVPAASVQLGEFALAPQRLAAARNIAVLSDSVKFDLCSSRDAHCDPRLRISDKPIIVFVWKARREWAIEPLAERPSGQVRPSLDPLLPLSVPARWTSANSGRPNWYPLSRLSIGTKMPEAQFYSTSRKWPLAFCFRNLFDRMNCSVGFLVKGTFVEAHAFPKAIPNQREMWDLSAAIEETVLNASQ